MNNKIIYEFIGLPGLGKTTLCKRLEKEISFFSMTNLTDYLTGKNNLEKLWFLILFLLKNLKITFYLIKYLFYNRGTRNQTMVLEFLKITTYSYYIMLKSENDIIILDQGFIQALSAILLYTENKDTLEFQKIINELNKRFNFKCIFLDSDIELALQRITSRAKTACELDIMDERTIKEFLQEHIKSFKIIVDYLDGEQIFLLDSKNPIDENIKILLKRCIVKGE